MSLKQLRDRLNADGVNKNDQAIIMITACIEAGISDGREIRSRLVALGYNGQSIGIQLSQNAGPNPNLYRWYKNVSGHYCLHSTSD